MEKPKKLIGPLAIAALTALLTLPVATSPAGAQSTAPERPKLRAVNVIRGSAPASVSVRLTRDARISGTIRPHRKAGPSSDIDISHVDQAAAIALIPDPLPEAWWSKPNLIAGQFERCFEPDCVSTKMMSYQFPGTYPRTDGAKWVALPAGNYRLYLVTTSPTKVTLRLDGLRGVGRIAPQQPVTLDLKTPQESLVYDQAGSVFSAGDTYNQPETGIILAALYAHADTKTDFEYGLCSYEDQEAPPPEVAYGPNCTAAADGAGATGLNGGGRSMGLIALFPYSNDSGEELGLGAWISAPAMFDTAGAHALLLGFE